jgi:hypothetical protein
VYRSSYGRNLSSKFQRVVDVVGDVVYSEHRRLLLVEVARVGLAAARASLAGLMVVRHSSGEWEG